MAVRPRCTTLLYKKSYSRLYNSIRHRFDNQLELGMKSIVSFGLWLKQRRRFLDMTQEELATRIGCSVQTIRKIESDERRPSKQVAERMAEQLSIPLSERGVFLQCARTDFYDD